MSPSNLALIFTTVIFGEDESVTLESAMNGSKVRLLPFLTSFSYSTSCSLR